MTPARFTRLSVRFFARCNRTDSAKYNEVTWRTNVQNLTLQQISRNTNRLQKNLGDLADVWWLPEDCGS